jgi:hypothetical protein
MLDIRDRKPDSSSLTSPQPQSSITQFTPLVNDSKSPITREKLRQQLQFLKFSRDRETKPSTVDWFLRLVAAYVKLMHSIGEGERQASPVERRVIGEANIACESTRQARQRRYDRMPLHDEHLREGSALRHRSLAITRAFWLTGRHSCKP